MNLVLANGVALDETSGRLVPRSVCVADGRVVAVADRPDATWSNVVDLHGDIIVPGLVDMHTHVFDGVGDSVSGDEFCLARGTTTAVDAGSAGARTLRAFRRVRESARMRLLAWLNLSTIGLVDANVGELIALPWVDVDQAVGAVAANRDIVVGIKARLSSCVLGGSAKPVLKLLRQAADLAQVPVMVHVGDTAEALRDILVHLRAGDVVTHAFTGRRNGVLESDGALSDAVLRARARGVLFDVARGGNHASFPVMERAVKQGFLPDTISTDITVKTAACGAFDMALVATELMSFGVEVEQLIPMMTTKPAAAINRPELGALTVGRAAEATVLRVERGEFLLRDVDGRPRRATRRLRVAGVLHDGRYHSRPPLRDTAMTAAEQVST